MVLTLGQKNCIAGTIVRAVRFILLRFVSVLLLTLSLQADARGLVSYCVSNHPSDSSLSAQAGSQSDTPSRVEADANKILCVCLLPLHLELVALEEKYDFSLLQSPDRHQSAFSTVPPELSQTWQFTSRQALPPRAPNSCTSGTLIK